MGEWERDIREIKLVEFQQWLGKKIPTEEEDEMFRKPLSMNINTIHDRNKRMKKKLSKEDYEEYLRQMRERIKREHSSQLNNN